MSKEIPGSLDLASAGSLEFGKAAVIATTARTRFGVSGQDISHIADLLAPSAAPRRHTT